MTLQDQTIAQFLDRLAAKVPAPGGGATAALTVAQGAALVAMVSRYSDSAKYDANRERIDAAVAEADDLRATALQLAADDEAAFGAVGAAYGLPKATDEEKAARQDAIAASLIGAAEPPIQVVSVAARVVQLAGALVEITNPNLVTDLAAAAECARAAAGMGLVNILINVGGIRDQAAAQRCRDAAASVDGIRKDAENVVSAVVARIS